MNIEWPKNEAYIFTGRNGVGFCCGVEVMPLTYGKEPKVMLSPITSYGVVGRCDMMIPIEKIPDLIRALRAAKKEYDLAKS